MRIGNIEHTSNSVVTPVASGNVQIGTKSAAFASGVFDKMTFGVATYEREYNYGVANPSGFIVWPSGNKQAVSVGGSPTTLVFTDPPGACNLLLRITQATGSNTVTWPGSVKWADATPPDLSTASGSIDIASFYFNGQNYYGMLNTDFQ